MSMQTTEKLSNDKVLMLHNLQLNSYLKIKELRSKLKLYDFDSGAIDCKIKPKTKFKETEKMLMELDSGKTKLKKSKQIIQLL